MDLLEQILSLIKEVLGIRLFSAGDSPVTIWTLVSLVILTLLLFVLTGHLKQWIVTRLLSQSKVDLGVRIAIGAIVRYIVITIGLIIIFQSVGIDLSTLTIVAGALGVGIGFGLQNITNNLVSGFIRKFVGPSSRGESS